MAMEVVMIVVYTLALSLVISVIYKLLTNQDEMKKIKEETEHLKGKADRAKKDGDTASMNKYTSEMLKVSSKQFKITMKPMMASMLVFIVVIGWFGVMFGSVIVNTPFAGFQLDWFWWYIIITLPATMAFRKMMGVM